MTEIIVVQATRYECPRYRYMSQFCLAPSRLRAGGNTRKKTFSSLRVVNLSSNTTTLQHCRLVATGYNWLWCIESALAPRYSFHLIPRCTPFHHYPFVRIRDRPSWVWAMNHEDVLSSVCMEPIAHTSLDVTYRPIRAGAEVTQQWHRVSKYVTVFQIMFQIGYIYIHSCLT